MANVEGKATALTALTPVRRGGPLLLWIVFWAGRNLTSTLAKLEQLSFIHYARWAVIKRFPDGNGGERVGHSYLFFESNFNGTWDQYIDAFSEVVPFRMKAIWGTSVGFPGSASRRAVQELHPPQRVRREPLLVGLPRRNDDRDRLRRSCRVGVGRPPRTRVGTRARRF